MLFDYSSKRLQLLKHITGLTYQLLMLTSASFAGTYAAGVTLVVYIVVSRGIGILLPKISSQLDYWQNKAIIKEELEEHALMREELAMHVETSHIESKVNK